LPKIFDTVIRHRIRDRIFMVHGRIHIVILLL